MDHYNTQIGFWTALAILVGVWVMIDAAKRGLSGLAAFLWGLFAFLLPCIGLPAWLLYRPLAPGEKFIGRPVPRLRPRWSEIDSTSCPACGEDIAPNEAICPACGIHFGRPAAEREPPGE